MPRELRPADAPKLNESVDNIVIIDGLPIAPAAKVEKLTAVVKKVVKDFRYNDLEVVTDSDGATVGFAFMELVDADEAHRAIAKLDGYKMDKKHTFSLMLMSDFDKYMSTPDEWQEPKLDDYNDELNNLQSWLLNEECNDQFVVIYGNVTRVCWNTRDRFDLIQERPGWTEKGLAWSPKGSYLTTFHPQGIALWGTPEWKRVAKFAHPQVGLVDFSPCERFVVTWSNAANTPAIIFWDIKTGQKLRDFPATTIRESWPLYKWSHDGNYFAKLGENSLAVYETPSMTKLNKKNIAIPSIQAFEWSPSDNVVAYWTPEKGSRPARVVIMSIPDQKEIASRNIYNVKECRFSWHPQGDFLCVQVTRLTKSKKKVFYDFEIFLMREKLIPHLNFEIKDTSVHGFSWEPKGEKFAVTTGTDKESTSIRFFDLGGGKGVNKLGEFNRSANVVLWNPQGRYCMFGSGANISGELNFVDTKDMIIMNTGEHMMANQIQWDPTGRYLVSAMSGPTDSGVIVWNFQGQQLQRYNINGFKLFLWRPRPESLLDESDIEKIKADFKRYQAEFEAKDKLRQERASREEIEQRRKLAKEWEEFRSRKRSSLSEGIQQRLKSMRPALQTERLQTVEYEVLMKEEEEVVSEA